MKKKSSVSNKTSENPVAVPSSVPKHIGIILDGNRRFAKRLMLKPWKGHEWGAGKVKKVLEWSDRIGIKEITFYTFSLENFNRPKREFDYLMNLFVKEAKEISKDPKIMEKGLKISFIGKLNLFPKKVQEVMNLLMEKTKNNNKKIVNFAMAYSGRAEIIDAAKKVAEQVRQGKLDISQINEETFSKNLYIESEPDLIIRTSESRLSGFLPYQSVYSEIIFLPNKLWPEFEEQDFINCIKEYQHRQRRFGK